MNQKYLFLIIGLVVLAAVGSRFLDLNLGGTRDTNPTQITQQAQTLPATDCKPTFADGGGPYYLPNQPMRTNLAPPHHNGQKLVVTGKILKKDCQTPVTALLDIWHADENGEYVNDFYRGRLNTAADGSYSFESVIPKGYGEGTGYRPPHIHFKVFIDNREIITSQMFFPDAASQPGFDDEYIVVLEQDGDVYKAYHDIILPI